MPLVIKDLQQYPEWEKESELLCEAMEKGVVNIVSTIIMRLYV